MKSNDIVRYAKPGTGEEALRFKVLEATGDRAQIVCINSGLTFPPVETVSLSDVLPMWNAYTARFWITTAKRAAMEGQRQAGTRLYGYVVRCDPPADAHPTQVYCWCKTREIAEEVLAGYERSKREGTWGCPCGRSLQARHCCGIPKGVTK